MQHDNPSYQSDQDRLAHPKPDEAEDKLGSAQPNNDPFDAVGGPSTGEIPAEYVAAEQRPVQTRPAYAIPPETQPTNFITPEVRPSDVRPKEVFPTELR